MGPRAEGGVSQQGNYQLVNQFTDAANLSYRFDNGKWRVEAALSTSESATKRRDDDAGMFQNFSASMNRPVRVSFLDVGSDRPGGIQVFDNNNQPVDIYDISNYRATTAALVKSINTSDSKFGNLNIRRRFEILPFPSSVQIGGSKRVQSQGIKGFNPQWTYTGGNDLNPYLMQVYRNQDSGFGFKNLPWLSPSRAWSAFQANPTLFAPTLEQQISEKNYRLTNSEVIEEAVSAAYLQAEANLFKNRLKVLTGVRYEKTVDEGWGSLFDPDAVFERNANGSFARNAAGQLIRKAEAGTAGSLQEIDLTRRERAARGYRTYDGYYPSLHLTYEVKENFLARVAYAKTYGRPNFNNIIPRTTIDEFDLTDQQLDDPNVARGTLTVRNAALRPWSADNYDLSLEYYTKEGGQFSVGLFLKELRDFFGSAVRFATLADLEQAGLDPRYVGWNLSTMFNSGAARITGAEFNIRHSLRQLGRWGSYFTVFANATKLKLEGNQQASFTSFIPESGNWGVSFNRKQVNATARWNYRGLDKRTALPSFGVDGFTYIKARTTLDLSLGYQLTRRLSLVSSVNNLFNEPRVTLRYGSTTPNYARLSGVAKFGAAFAIGVKGTF